MMAIGDSMFNGMTSLTIDADRAKLSLPNLVARALGIAPKFREVDYSRPVLFNLETELRKNPVKLLATFGKGVISNIKFWQQDYPPMGGTSASAREPLFFDNVAIAGATSDQLLCDTAAKNNELWRGVEPKPGFLDVPSGLGDWHQEINTSFILNPRDLDGQHRAPDLSKLSQMAEVWLRKPVRLLINIGSNDGVWRAGFNGEAPDPTELQTLIANMKMIVRLIPDETKFVYVDNLIPPSRVPNLNPISSDITRNCPNGKVYYNKYQTYLSLGPLANVLAADACEFDQTVAKLNDDIKRAMQDELSSRVATDPGARNIQLQFVDISQLLWTYDRKHYADAKAVDVKWRGHVIHLTNWVVHPARLLPLPHPRTGGLSGYDNMHPTMVMYGRGAEAVLDEITATTGPEKKHPDPSTPPVTVFDPANLPQCVADDLANGNLPSRACPEPSDARPVQTAINMGIQEDDNLILAHEVLSAAGSPAQVLIAVQGGSRSTARDRIQNAAAGCVLAQTLDLIGKGSRSPSDSAKYARLNATCAKIRTMWNAISH